MAVMEFLGVQEISEQEFRKATNLTSDYDKIDYNRMKSMAMRGDLDAIYNMGYAYQHGIHFSKNEEEALSWYQKAATIGDSEACREAAKIYMTNEKLKDVKKAAEYWEKGARCGEPTCQYNLGICYSKGCVFREDRTKAFEWIMKAANQGLAAAQMSAGCFYEFRNGVRGLQINMSEAIRWYSKAADQGDAEANYNMGVHYENGRGVSVDHQKAMKYYRVAAEDGLALAQDNLGLMYIKGQGVKADLDEAINWITMAAEQDLVSAQGHLAYCLIKQGEETPKKEDEEKIKYWLKKAADGGDEWALEVIKNIKAKGIEL